MKINVSLVVVLSLFLTRFSFAATVQFQHPSGYDSLKVIEKVYLHADRDNYYPGDDIWFKAYLIDATNGLLSSNSMNLHVELISPDQKIIDSRVVALNNGLGNGDFHLSEKLNSGSYRLRAYTNYMRNFGDQLFFNKEIRIINSLDAGKAFSDSANFAKTKLEINFFPEGGSLVENVASMVAFKAVDDNGYGQNVSGEVYSSTGERVTEFRSTHKGMGSFSLTPLPGLRYFALTKSRNGDSLKYEIPKSFSKGVVLDISKNQVNQLSLIFKTNPETFPDVSANDLSVTVSIRNIAYKTYSFRMKSLNSFLNIPTQDLPDGIIMLTLSGADNIPLCERLVYIQNNEELKLNVETNKSDYNQRDSVSIRLSLSDSSGKANGAFLSLSATKVIAEKSSSPFPSNISSWFLLESDVRGQIEEPSYYFDHSNPDRLKDLDLLLLTHGWRDFKWKYENHYYLPENGFTISGRIREIFSDIPLKNSRVSIGIFKNGNPIVSIVKTDTSGRFRLDGVELTGEAKLIVSAADTKGQSKGWVLLDSINYSPAGTKYCSTRKNLLQNGNKLVAGGQFFDDTQFPKSGIIAYIQYAEIRNSIQKRYKLSDTITPGEVVITAKRRDIPDSPIARSHHYLLTNDPDYEYQVTPESEVFNNLGQLIIFRIFHKGGSGMTGLLYNQPLVLLDGMEVGWEGIEFLPVAWIERFDGVRPGSPAALMWGARGRGGVISVITRTGAPITPHHSIYNSASVRLSGYDEPRVFFSPKHHSTLDADYKPDLRTTLFWEPDIKMENNKDYFLNYFNADNPSKVEVIVEGITSSGIPVTGKTEYEVK
jgi:hypothetical protein